MTFHSSRLEGEGRIHGVFVASCEADRVDDILVEIHNAGLELVTIHDRPQGTRLGAYHYIIEVEDPAGIPEELLEKMEAIAGLRSLGSFDVIEK